eukprot:TRINITY_DN3749_c0_g1_i1.p1 TRINITY_DN3749_c0_g1~~TRINITY_DN3749_c0_g1_i1.p1  ORF type:complete len:255 (+),score=38.89 TRINITY_DN3749_c0_g1_i1:140-904(+)
MKRMEKIHFQKNNDLYNMESGVAAPSLGASQTDDIRKDIKRLEQEIDHKFNTYSTFSERIEQWTEEDNGVGFGVGVSGGSDISPTSSLDELQILLEKLTDLNKSLNDSNSTASIRLHHRSKLEDYQIEFRRLKGNVTQAWERAQLMRGKKYQPLPDRNVTVDSLIRERGSINNSTSIADDLLMQAAMTRDRVHAQTERLLGTAGKLRGLTRQFPALNRLIGNIRWKKYKNTIILGGFIASCICFLIYYWLRSHS